MGELASDMSWGCAYIKKAAGRGGGVYLSNTHGAGVGSTFADRSPPDRCQGDTALPISVDRIPIGGLGLIGWLGLFKRGGHPEPIDGGLKR